MRSLGYTIKKYCKALRHPTWADSLTWPIYLMVGLVFVQVVQPALVWLYYVTNSSNGSQTFKFASAENKARQICVDQLLWSK